MTKSEQMDKMARYLGIAVAVGILTKTNAQVILDKFGKKCTEALRCRALK